MFKAVFALLFLLATTSPSYALEEIASSPELIKTSLTAMPAEPSRHDETGPTLAACLVIASIYAAYWYKQNI